MNRPHQLRWQKNPLLRLNRPLLPRLCRSKASSKSASEVGARSNPFTEGHASACPISFRGLGQIEWDAQKLVPPILGRSVSLQSETGAYKLRAVKQFLEFIIRQLVEFPDEMMLSEIPSGKTTIFRVQLRQTDVGRIIGRNGQTIQAIRALLASSAARHGQRATLEIVE